MKAQAAAMDAIDAMSWDELAHSAARILDTEPAEIALLHPTFLHGLLLGERLGYRRGMADAGLDAEVGL